MNYITEVKSVFDNIYVVLNSKYICMFGLGNIFNNDFEKLLPIYGGKVDFVCDNNPEKWGQYYKGIKCISPNELYDLKDDVGIIITMGDGSQVYKQLIDNGLTKVVIATNLWWTYDKDTNFGDSKYIDKINKDAQKVVELFADEYSKKVFCNILKSKLSYEGKNNNYKDFSCNLESQYFYEEFFQIDNDECYVDGGAYNGDTLLELTKITQNRFQKAYLFELDKKNYEKLTECVSKLDNETKSKIKSYNMGLWNKKDTVNYSGESTSTMVSDFSTDELDITGNGLVDRLDNLLGKEKVTLFKLDIEGAEMNALYGAENTIKNQTPKLAICVYHLFEDLIYIPLLIKSFNPNYNFYLRHYTDNYCETVCYALM